MEDREKKIIDALKAKAETINVPGSLEPEQVRKRVEEQETGKKKRGSARTALFLGRRKIAGAAAAAAVLALVCLGIPVWRGERKEADSGRTLAGESAVETLSWETADDYDAIYEYIQAHEEEKGQTAGAYARTMEDSMYQSGAESAQAPAEEILESSAQYSGTNVRQDGVDEGDIAKTDGRYIFTLTVDEEIAVVDTKDGLKHVAAISEDRAIREFYIVGEQLILICGRENMYGNTLDGGGVPDETTVVTYDISDREAPAKVGEVSQSGQYHSSRLAGHFLYTFSLFYVNAGASIEERELYIPKAGDSLMEPESLYLPAGQQANLYLVMTAVDIEKPEILSDSRAIFAKSGELYVSTENIYWYEYQFQNSGLGLEKESTLIRKIAYGEGKLEAKEQGSVPGMIVDSFSIDEYEGNLRVVTTNGSGNGLYIFNEKMEEIARLDELAKGERVYASRLFGSIGYFVTFRNTDPLFSVDLSDPEAPRIIGELKIPGFSEYLHFYGEGRLLGIGMDADEETGETKGVKLTMFDTGRPEDVKEEDTFIMENVYSTDVFYDYKAALIDPEKNVIGFSAYEGACEKYFVFSYDSEEGFQCRMSENVNGSSYRAARGIYIGDILYVVKGNIIEAYGMDDYSKQADLII